MDISSIDCRYCGAGLTDTTEVDWQIGERQSFPCGECGCVTYVTPEIEYRTSSYGEELQSALKELAERHGGVCFCRNGDVTIISMPYRGVRAELRTYIEDGYGAVGGLHVSVGRTRIPVPDLVGLPPDKAAVRLLLRIFHESRKQWEAKS